MQPSFTPFNTGIDSETRFLCRTLHADWSYIDFMILTIFSKPAKLRCAQGVEGRLKIYKDQLKG